MPEIIVDPVPSVVPKYSQTRSLPSQPIHASLSQAAQGAAMWSIMRRLGSVKRDRTSGPRRQIRCIIVGTIVTQFTS